MSSPRFNIIIPAFNSERYLSETVCSVKAQTVSDWELVIVDDGSSDGTIEAARSAASADSRIRVLSQPNGGVARARNRGFAESRQDGAFVSFLDHDDLLHPDALEVLSAALSLDTAAVAAYGFPREIDASGASQDQQIDQAFGFYRLGIVNERIRHVPPSSPTAFDTFVIWDPISTPGQVLIRRSAVEDAGGFDPFTAPSDDWDLWVRLSIQGHFKPVVRFVVDKRTHGSNQSRGKGLKGAGYRMRTKLATTADLSAEHRRLAQLGHRYGPTLQLRWMRDAFMRRDPVLGLRLFRQAVIAWQQYKSIRY